MFYRSLAPATVLSGRYQLGAALGESDLSHVYAAADLRSQAQVALKVFDPSVAVRAAALSEYQSLARLASGLGVEGIARAYDFGIDANTGLAFSTAERISWASLDRRVLTQGPLGIQELSRGLRVLGRALDAAHAAGVVHRDLKPQNVFISPDNPEWVRITDFGVNALRRGSPEAMGWGGPPGYTPPDAVDASTPAGPSADFFALGVLTFFALTRGTPFRSLRSKVFDANAHWSELNQSLNPISERAKELGVALDPVLDPWFSRALSLDPSERFRNAGELSRELSAIAERLTARGPAGLGAMPGIAAAIAQPLVFQPEPSPASLGLAATQPVTPPPVAAAFSIPAPEPAPRASTPDEDLRAGLPTRSAKVPLLIGAGVLLFAGVAAAGYAVFTKASEGAAPPAVSAQPSTAPPAPPAPSVEPQVSPAPSASAAKGPTLARFICQPASCEWVVCDGQNLKGFDKEVEVKPGLHDCSASRYGFGSRSLSYTAREGELTEVLFELPPLPPAAQKKAANAPDATAKPAAKEVAKPAKEVAQPAAKETAKPATKDPKKKKCSTFLGCK